MVLRMLPVLLNIQVKTQITIQLSTGCINVPVKYNNLIPNVQMILNQPFCGAISSGIITGAGFRNGKEIAA